MKRMLILVVVLLAGVITAQAYRTFGPDQTDAQILLGSIHFALENSPTHRSTSWANPATGLTGSTIPTVSYRLASGQYCREYLTTVEGGGIRQQSFGTACRQEDGSWDIANQQPVKEYASVNRQMRGESGPQSICPRHFLPQAGSTQKVDNSALFRDPYLAHIHQFLFRKAAPGNFHNWPSAPGRTLERWHGGPYHNWTHPPINPERFKQPKPSELVKLVDNRTDY